MTGAVPPARSAATSSNAPSWPAYAAALWALAFSAQSFYYAAGGTAGAETWPPAIVEPVLRRDPTWVAVMWGTGAAKVAAGLFALALARARPWPAIGRAMFLAGLIGGSLAALYGLANLLQHALMVAGVVVTPAGLGDTAARWHLVLWDPYWIAGGVLFVLAARSFRQRLIGDEDLPHRAGGAEA